MREQPEAVLKRLEQAVLRNHRTVISAITYQEMRSGATARRLRRAILRWLMRSAPASMPSCPGSRGGRRYHGHPGGAAPAGTPIGPNDTAIAGHAYAAGAILVTNNTREFERVPGLVLEDWVN
jgi:tRNA(fMet)-specific endonuclease VapC